MTRNTINVVIGLALLAIVMILFAIVINVDKTGPAPDSASRFTSEKYDISNQSCIARVITDNKPGPTHGCQYLMTCNDLAAMPHTCDKDK
jgi:hypothetical protein